MEWIQLWAGITFTAQNGDIEGLLTAAAAGGLHLFDIVPRPGGFSARCAAWHYRKLAALARRRRVRLRIQKRRGLFFCIRPLLRRRGLWAGCLVFLPLLLWLQGFVWFVEPVGLTPGQQARAAVVLWEAGLFPGNAVTQEKLTAGEYAHRDSFVQLTGTQDVAAHQRFTLEDKITPATPPVFVWHTMEDETVPVENTLLLLNALHKAGVPCEAQLFEKGCHGASISTPEVDADSTHRNRWVKLAVEWLDDTFSFHA